MTVKARYSIIAKGPSGAVATQAAAHGVAVAFEATWEGLVTGWTNADPAKLNEWLCEPPGEPPFPAGALLCWSDHSKEYEREVKE